MHFLEFIEKDKPFILFEKNGRVDLYLGTIHELQKLSDIDALAQKENKDVAFILPYHIIRERGFEAKGDEPIIGLCVHTHHSFTLDDIIDQIPDGNIEIEGKITPSLSDTDYADLIGKFQKNEIEGGLVSQTTISRKFEGAISNLSLETLLGTFKKIIAQRGHYIAALYSNPADDQYILAATPERHLEVAGTQTVMTPIAGTLRKEDKETFEPRLKSFIGDKKEINELFQVLDEELKIMGLICPEGGKIEGPYLREVGAVVHTEYNLIGQRTLHSIDALRETLHAPTVVGSPMESAARAIAKYEPESRRYYAGEIGIYKCPHATASDGDIDSAILIRMVEINEGGKFCVQAGGGIVRDSLPANEVKESSAKAQGILRYFQEQPQKQPYLTAALYKKVKAEFEGRNESLSAFWMNKHKPDDEFHGSLKDIKVHIVNNEDNFAYMIAHLVRNMGADVSVFDTFKYKYDDAALVITGPGPGNPNDLSHHRIKKLHDITTELLEKKKPFIGICLGHQVLSIQQGLEVLQQETSTQGMPRSVSIQGKKHELGFYNSFSPFYRSNGTLKNGLSYDLDDDNRIIALYGPHFESYQFHPESVMSKTGIQLLQKSLLKMVDLSK